MCRPRPLIILALFCFFGLIKIIPTASATDLSSLKRGQQLSDFYVSNLYSDIDGKIMGAKFNHMLTGAPIFVIQIETVPQAFMWVDTPVTSDKGLPHALEHLLAGKGTRGRYASLLRDMRLSQSTAATWRDFNYYSFASGSGMDSFFELLHAWLNALYEPDFNDAEAENEFYHFSVSTDPATKTKVLTEGGSVYNERLNGQGEENCYFELHRRVLGNDNPLAANILGTPSQMRSVTPREIRQFYIKHYHLGPTTGFIFVIDPKEKLADFLQRVSEQLKQYVPAKPAQSHTPPSIEVPKYPIHPSDDIQPVFCPVPGANEADPGDIWFASRPIIIKSLSDLRLLQFFYEALADGQASTLYHSLIDSQTREMDTGATAVRVEPFFWNSPMFPFWKIEVSGVPGNRISVEKLGQMRNLIVQKIQQVSQYPDGSLDLVKFNALVSSYAQSWRRSRQLLIRNPPLFGSIISADWKELLEYIEMDPSFVKSLGENEAWNWAQGQLSSGKNFWRELIHKYDVAGLPYATAWASSPELLKKLEQDKKERFRAETNELMEKYRTKTDQEALLHFEADESTKTKEIDQIQAKVPRPQFTDHPPLTLDDGIRYSQFAIEGVPTIAALFNSPPTIDIQLSFDLHRVPRKYYRYLPILAKSFDSLGLKEPDHITPYSDLLLETKKRFLEFAAGIQDNPVTHRADFTFRASAASSAEFLEALDWIERVLRFNYLDLGNLPRLQDLVSERLSTDDSYTKQDQFSWIWNPALAFRHQDDLLYVALESEFTQAYWDGRLRWLLHAPVSPEKIEGLAAFATTTLSSVEHLSKVDLSKKLSELRVKGLEQELVEYWRRNLDSFPEEKLSAGLRSLAVDVQRDLKTGPVQAIDELRELQRIVVNRHALHIDLTLSQSSLEEIRPRLVKFLQSVPESTEIKEPTNGISLARPFIEKLKADSRLINEQAPWYIGFVNPQEVAGNIVSYSDFIGYDEIDRSSLLRLLASDILAGRGPNSLYSKARAAGLAYGFVMRSDPGKSRILYYADRSLDVPSLISAMNTAAKQISQLHDPNLLDYVLRQTFSVPRSIYTSTLRGWLLTQDIRDGNTPEKVHQFSEAILKLRHDPNLLQEITQRGPDAICGIRMDEECHKQQTSSHTIFLFVGSEKTLSDIEKRIPIPRLTRVWPSDFWIN